MFPKWLFHVLSLPIGLMHTKKDRHAFLWLDGEASFISIEESDAWIMGNLEEHEVLSLSLHYSRA